MSTIIRKPKMLELSKEFLAEFVGTAILMFLGCSGSATGTLKDNPNGLTTAICYAMGAIIAMFFCGEISGAQINPAFTLAFCVIKKCAWHKLPVYLLAQYLGAFVGSALIYGLYYEGIQGYDLLHFNETHTNFTAHIFVTYPSVHTTLWPAIADQIASTALLIFGVLFITDQSCYQTPKAIQHISVGFLIFTMVAGFSYNADAILNPARDLAPRVLLSMVGYEDIPFKPLNYNFWWAVGIVAVHIGGILGALIYVFMARIRTASWEASELMEHSLQTVVQTHYNPSARPEHDVIYQKGNNGVPSIIA